MKRTFTIITLLITISLIRDHLYPDIMAEKYDIAKAGTDKRKSRTGRDDGRRRAGSIQRQLPKQQDQFGKYNVRDEFTMEFLRPVTIGKRFTATELQDKIKKGIYRLELDKLNLNLCWRL